MVSNRSALNVVGTLVGVLAGALDECIQEVLPSRVFTLHDVIVNGASATVALVFLRIHQPEPKAEPTFSP